MTDFQEVMGVRCSLGASFRDRFRGHSYIVWITRHGRSSTFRDGEALLLRRFCHCAGQIVSLRSEVDALSDQRCWDPEFGYDADILSTREAEVAKLLCRRLSMREIGAMLHISPRTVDVVITLHPTISRLESRTILGYRTL